VPDAAPNPDLLRSLGCLVRGLSALFWGLPVALVVCVQTARADWLKSFGVLPPLATTALLCYGVWQIGAFQKQERVWRTALDRAQILSLLNVGLSPFVFWWNRMPDERFFSAAVAVFALSALLFLVSLNLVLQRLGAMLPDETLRQETRQYTRLDCILLLATLALTGAYLGASACGHPLPEALGIPFNYRERYGFGVLVFGMVFLVLLPLAMTMALLWKTKQVVLDSVFGRAG